MTVTGAFLLGALVGFIIGIVVIVVIAFHFSDKG